MLKAVQKRLNRIFQEWSPYIDSLSKNYQELVKKDLQLDVLKDKTSVCQKFLNDFETINDLKKQLNTLLNLQNYTMSTANVYDVLTSRYKNSKGWRVEFLD